MDTVGGRPRKFDTDEALSKAMEIFWRKGYDGTSLEDLTQSMGINRPSLYAAFGNKEALFRAALERYARMGAEYACPALERAQVRDALGTYMIRLIELQTQPGKPAGCLMVQGAIVWDDENASIRDALAKCRETAESDIKKRLERAKAEGEISAACDTACPAKYFAALSQGLALQAASGIGRDCLTAVVETALSVLETA